MFRNVKVSLHLKNGVVVAKKSFFVKWFSSQEDEKKATKDICESQHMKVNAFVPTKEKSKA